MKSLILATAAALAVTGPALASPLAIANDVFAASYETGDGPRGPAGDVSGDTVEAVRAHLAQSHETGDGARFDPAAAGGDVVSTASADLIAYAKAKLDNDLRGDN